MTTHKKKKNALDAPHVGASATRKLTAFFGAAATAQQANETPSVPAAAAASAEAGIESMHTTRTKRKTEQQMIETDKVETSDESSSSARPSKRTRRSEKADRLEESQEEEEEDETTNMVEDTQTSNVHEHKQALGPSSQLVASSRSSSSSSSPIAIAAPLAKSSVEVDLDAIFALDAEEEAVDLASKKSSKSRGPNTRRGTTPVPSSGGSRASETKSPIRRTNSSSSNPNKNRTRLSFALPSQTTRMMNEVRIDPQVLLEQMVSTRELKDLHDNFDFKLERLLHLIVDPTLHQAWCLGTCIQLFLQLNMSFMHATSTPSTIASKIFLPVLSPVDEDLLDRPWNTQQARVFMNVLQAVTEKTMTLLREATSAARVTSPAAVGGSTTTTSSIQSSFTPLMLNRLGAIIHLLTLRFPHATHRGSCASAMPPTEEQQCHASYFRCYIDFLYVLVEPIRLLPERLQSKLREFLLQVISEESRIAMMMTTSMTTTSSSTIKEEIVSGSIIMSHIPCCRICNHHHQHHHHHHHHTQPSSTSSSHRSTLPALTPTGIVAVRMFERLCHSTGISIDTASELSRELREHLDDYDAQIAFLTHLSPLILRVYFIGIILPSFFHSTTVNDIIFGSNGMSDGLQPFVQDDETFHRHCHSHTFLSSHFEWMDDILHKIETSSKQWLKDMRSEFHKLRTKKVSEEMAWKGVPIVKEITSTNNNKVDETKNKSKSTKSSTSTTTSHHHQPSLRTTFARQELKKLESVTTVSVSLEDQQSLREASTIRALELERLELSRFLEEVHRKQRHSINLITLLIDAVSSQMHQHVCSEHPHKEDDERPSSLVDDVDDDEDDGEDDSNTSSLVRASSIIENDSSVESTGSSSHLTTGAPVPPVISTTASSLPCDSSSSSSIVCSQVSDATSTYSSPSKSSRGGGSRKTLPLPCRCRIERSSTIECDEIETFKALHHKLHTMQAKWNAL